MSHDVEEAGHTSVHLLTELRTYLDTLTITSDNIGDTRRSLFLPWESLWNGWVRDETAVRENVRHPRYPFDQNPETGRLNASDLPALASPPAVDAVAKGRL